MKLKIQLFLAFCIYRILTMTYRVRVIDAHYEKDAQKMHPKGSYVFGVWHEYFIAAVALHAYRGISPMISSSRDGEFITFIARKLGFRPIRGSTTRGGEAARQEFYGLVDQGLVAAFTADGPRGPRRKLKSGIVDLSRNFQIPILPVAFHADRCWRLSKSWDRSMIPKPFARLTAIYGKPFIVDADAHGAAFAAAKRHAESALNQLSSIADKDVL